MLFRSVIDKAVRLVIMLIICVFDPLAILLLIAANMEMRKGTPRVSTPEKREEKVMETPSAILPKKPKKPIKPKKPSIPKKKPVKPKVKPTPKKKPVKPKKRPLKKKSVDRKDTGLDDVITIKKSTVYRFDG